MSRLARSPAGNQRARRWWMVMMTTVLCFLCQSTFAQAEDSAARLRDKYQSLTQQLAYNQFRRPLYLESQELPSALKGDIYGVVNYPFALVSGALSDPAHGPANWCDVLILHLNTKYCHASTDANGTVLTVNIGKKTEESLSSSYRVQFNFHPVASTPDYFRVELGAATGPLSTKDYRIVLEAIPVGDSRTFIHLTYAYGYGTAGRLAMKTYLATIGSDKVGFSTTPDSSTGETQYIGGVRGLVERNTMRYYLAIDAYLGALASPPNARVDKRFADWFDATEQYPRQLHEVSRTDYLQMKHNEYQRQQIAQ
ncbi:putative signal peptide protein [Burkholderia sp. H160]|nr:putative signal peptide protein [Burkholderia sp. H160]